MSINPTNANAAIKYLKANSSWTIYGICGFLGNVFAESGITPANLQNTYEKSLGYSDAQYTAMLDSGKYTRDQFINDHAGYGLCQWTFWSRKQNFYDWMKNTGKSFGDLEAQLSFAVYEIEGYKSVAQVLKTANDVRTASDSVLLNYEKPASVLTGDDTKTKEVCDKRYVYANDIFENYLKEEYGMGIVCMHTNQPNYKQAKMGVPVGILWHSTGCNNPNIGRYCCPSTTDANYEALKKEIGNISSNNWNRSAASSAGVNAFIGKKADGTVDWCQVLEWTKMPWGCGSGSLGSANCLWGATTSNPGAPFWIQFEICEDDKSDQTYANNCYDKAIEMCAMLCLKYGIDPHGTYEYKGYKIPTILCHQLSYRLGWGANHADIYHWTKLCKGKSKPAFKSNIADNYGIADPVMDMIRDDIANAMGNSSAEKTEETSEVTVVVEQKQEATTETVSTKTEDEKVTVELRMLQYTGSTEKEQMSGGDVWTLQRLLKAKGYANYTIDGYFGSWDLAAVKKFQAANGLDADGIVGALTWAKLLNNK